MALRLITDFPGNGITFDRVMDMTTEDPADRVSVKAVSGSLESASDYLPEEKALFGLERIASEFRANSRGAK